MLQKLMRLLSGKPAQSDQAESQRSAKKNSDANAHSVTVEFKLGEENIEYLSNLEEVLESLINEAGVGQVDGNEIAVDISHGFLYMYGPDADKLLEVVQPVISASFLPEASAELRYGQKDDDNARTKSVKIK